MFVGEGAQPGEDAGVVTDTRLILLESDIAGVVQAVLDVLLAAARNRA
jgi:hypothetical protein